MTSDLGRAFQISQAINVATEYVKQMNNAYIAPITVKYPHVENYSSCFYVSSEDTIYIRSSSADSGYPESYAAWDVLMHEYGHHVQAEFGISRSPGGKHSFNLNLADDRNSKDEGIRLAWGEAYASVFGGMAQAYYLSSLQNIFTVGDTAYLSYNTVTIDYETTAEQTGEACEATIIGILWDLYDNTASESHDTVSFSHSAYWDMITNCNSENLSEFCNYYNSRYSTSKALALGKILSYYKVSASELSANIGGTTPTFNWTANGTSSTLPNNKFDLIFLTANNYVTLRINDITSTTYTLSNDEWETVLNSYGTTYSVVVIAYQTSAPSTGGYYSELLNVYKPTYNESSSITHNNVESRRYSEKIINLTPGSYYDLYVTFGTTGLKLIQTFGITDTALELYSASGALLIGANETDDDGYALNALIQCDITANTQYIIRIRFFDENKYGTTKISMTPGSCGTNTIECYEDITTITSTTTNWNSYTQLDHTSVVVFKPSITGSYTFELISEFDSYLYVIDPRSTNSLIRYTDFDDDSGDGSNGKLTRSLDAGVRYLIIYSGYNIENPSQANNITLSITEN